MKKMSFYLIHISQIFFFIIRNNKIFRSKQSRCTIGRRRQYKWVKWVKFP